MSSYVRWTDLLRLEYNTDADTAYLTMGVERPVAESRVAFEDFVLDVDEHGLLVGVEFVTASRWLHDSLRAAESESADE